MDNVLHTETIGRYTLKLWADYDAGSFENANDWGYTGAKLYANERNFYVMDSREQTMLDVVRNAPDGTKFYFVNWAQYSSANEPVLYSLKNPQGQTLEQLADWHWSQNYNAQDMRDYKKEYYDMSAKEIKLERFLVDSPDLPGDVMIVVEPVQTKDGHDAAYYGSTGKQNKDAQQCLEDWKHYLDGAYGWSILDEDDCVVESVGGYYGIDSLEDGYMAKEARETAQHLEAKAKANDKKIKAEAKAGSVTMSTTLAEMMTDKNPQVQRLAKGIYKEITKK